MISAGPPDFAMTDDKPVSYSAILSNYASSLVIGHCYHSEHAYNTVTHHS